MAIMMVSMDSGWQSHCGVRRGHRAVTLWSHQRVDGDQNVVSVESGWQSQCGVKREHMAITVGFQQRVDGDRNVISRANQHNIIILADNSLDNMCNSVVEIYCLLLMDCELDDTHSDYSVCH